MSPLVYVEDLDGDGTKEIIAASPDILNFPEDEVILLVFDAEGNVLFNKILFTDGKTSNGIGDLYVEDLDGDGTKEIIVMYDTYEDRGEESVHTCRLVVFGSKES